MNKEETLKEVKKAELNILITVDDFCKKNNIKYSLAYGTLLGAVRHKGFIPWDDDIDIWMTRENYNKFIRVWKQNPVQGYILQNTDLEEDFSQNFTKIRKDNTAFIQTEEEKTTNYHKGIFIDIFPLDRVAKTPSKIAVQKLYAMFTMLFYRKYAPPTEKGLKKYISEFFLKIVPKSKYENARKYFENKYLFLSGDVDCSWLSNSTYRDLSIYYDSDMMDDYTFLQFEGRNFMSVSKWDHALKMKYGDYMQLPPEEDRVWKHHPIFIDLNNNYEAK
ncbi:phosphorylcholine transferase LicD [uncultured Eubacterium sp.]|uniref:LicD family protein n=1 Tax=uncultured Eubacterium sp. TaxID=165185 RepID=UPI0025D0340E|nr:LicD family protein [uncultured Eubacterium sp.]